MAQGVRRARPHTAVTQDGRRIREVLTYSRRGSRLSDAQSVAWERRSHQWWIPDEAVDVDGVSVASWFGREAPLIVEIGSGIGEATAALAAARPDHDILAFEVWRPGVAETFLELERAGVGNVRMISVDAVWSFAHLIRPGTVTELWTFFPDPWPKTRHQRRRLVSPEFAGLAASRLLPGALWRLSTDMPDYADQMKRVLGAVPLLAGGPTERWPDRPRTRFERRGIRAGRPSADLCYRRI
ncbi:MAG: tRNA (guanine-N7)-methyltransferase [Nocardioidaceae bacterium]|nr:tRNA (guanine-N7)-methyltransferase [Nocardioidaceae bacterium]